MARSTATRATLPPAQFEIPDRLSHEGLVVHATSSDGTESFRYDLRALPGAEELKRQIAVAVARLCNEGGPWRSMQTVRSSTASVSNFLRWLDELDNPPTDLTGFRRGHWDQWVLRCAPTKMPGGMAKVSAIRRVLRGSPHVPAETLKAVARRTGKAPAPAVTTLSYTPDELASIETAAREVVAAAEQRVGANMRLLARYYCNPTALAGADLARASALDGVFHGRQLTKPELVALDAWANGQVRNRVPGRTLFLDSHEAWACAVLLAAENGWNASVIKRMTVPQDLAGAGEDFTIFTVELDKPRRGRRRHMSNNLVDDGETGDGRSMSLVLNATDPARLAMAEQGHRSTALIVWLKEGATDRDAASFGVGLPGRNAAVHSPWLRGLPPVTMRRLRQTHQSRIEAGPAQNSRGTHEDSYKLRDHQVRARALPVIEDGISDALAALETTFQLRLVSEEEAGPDITTGRSDTPVSACRDVHHHPLTGLPCQESFLACLDCENAVATPRHLPRLVYLYVAIASLQQVVDGHEWSSVWRVHYERLGMLLTAHTSEPERQAALTTVTETEKANVQRLLAGRFEL